MELPRLDNSNLWDKTYIILKDQILRGEFQPHQKLSILDLAAQLGVSRTPVRDALNRLEMDGLITTVPRVGTFVNAVEVDDVYDAVESRLMVDLWVVDKLATYPHEELLQKTEKLEEILNQASLHIEELSLEAYLKYNYNLLFHLEFIKLGNNAKNVDFYLEMMNYLLLATERSLITKEMALSAIEQHFSIIEALKQRRFENVKESIRLHLGDAKDRLIKRLQTNDHQL
ncbi:MAG: GntR family transcriptional regulator [Negativicutes bacterium]|nr:GntR family transcriptional regulator [Negativicutes bacterium]